VDVTAVMVDKEVEVKLLPLFGGVALCY